MTLFLGKENIEIEFYHKITLHTFTDKSFRANKIGFNDVECIVCDNLLSIITSDYDRIIIVSMEQVKSITEVDQLTVNQFGEPIEREDLEWIEKK